MSSTKESSADTNDDSVETPPRRAARAGYTERTTSSSSSLRGGGEAAAAAASRPVANGSSKNGRSYSRETVDLGDMMGDLKLHIDRSMAESRESSRRDFDRLLTVLQQESAKRTAVEGRLHAQLLMQSESMIALELKLLKLESKVERRERELTRTSSQNRARPLAFSRIEESPARTVQRPPSNVISSTASLASGVTANSLLEDGGEDDDTGQDEDSSNATPTHRVQVAGGNLESILLKPMIGETDGTSTRATRGDALTDGGSSMATSVTNSTFTSTVVTATTRGTHPQLVQLVESNDDEPGVEETDSRPPRSRSQSPLTVQSASVGGDFEAIALGSMTGPGSGAGSIASERTILTTGAVAPNRVNRSSRALANRVVSFDVMMQPHQPSGEAGGDSITMPDELDNLSEVADTFAASARLWRDEYEARLDALQKRWNAE
uniref:Uncharacterized protein n=1 Tax=Grammatophora oceanica TaxID=210454 RepID=A0A7S1Y5W4_9STRA|eukprot:CAMPEP_0194055752 /NCGR_PEP_ID=MMETSP0009_2-20130614/57803_1 /TAXON_ID=210454 /ORGANISM="Grammatophora oceanica, Strain CCMP 410" /LENGTH=436 /DNA_ID=CAMNT_0038704795 /DNA_START=104 /DNA_END=1414 /DNA_ORIENTATION=-